MSGSKTEWYGPGVRGRQDRRFTNVSANKICKLLQLFHHTRLDVPVITYLPECFVEPGILFQVASPFLCLWRSWCKPLQWRHSSRGEWHSILLLESQPGQIILCWQSVCASPILCRGTQSTWLNGHDVVGSQICLRLGVLITASLYPRAAAWWR